MISVERAREVLGEEGRRLADGEIAELCRDADALARWLYDRMLEEEAVREETAAA